MPPHAISASIENPSNSVPLAQQAGSLVEGDWVGCLSALTETESLWMAALSLQFLESCDEVILLEDGEICEKGTHKELMEERGRYAKLIHSLRGLQFKVTVGLPSERDLEPCLVTFHLGEVCHFTFRSNFPLSPGSRAHLQCSHGGDPEGEPSSEG